ncbi:uncharacterized protein LOC129766793 [Toxorhynchites rutilus septentrionalis]|uniref:uncharacterized protein LOC129766793 n=1 Tax=Toxorhynchites rutilus septentrionalis TaxID=329112 RepID=UPI00247AFA46|nr:uncharacterized protein LOC129766793 [Toxorhynchites rutilus septentrionalis]
MRQALRQLDMVSRKKQNLEGVAIPCGITITAPEYFKGIDDQTDVVRDLYAKANFPFIRILMHDLNFTINMLQMDTGGWKKNGTFSGVIGKFQNRSIELGCLGMLMRNERIEVVDFTIVTFVIKTSMLFRQPPLSLLTNIFELPFSWGVWMCCFAFTIVYWFSFIVLRVVTKSEPFTPIESLTFMMSTMCQQSYQLITHYNATQLLIFCAKLASFFIFTSYSASIVALLQSPSRVITSVADLNASPLKVGIMETAYGWRYYNESKQSSVQELFRRKIEPQGARVFAEADDGMKRVQNELYAFQVATTFYPSFTLSVVTRFCLAYPLQVEANAAYQIIKSTFTAEETCKIFELDAIQLSPISIPLVKGSKYREIFRQRLIRLQEVGIIRRINHIWSVRKPRCENGFTSFNSVSLREIRYSYIFMAVGFALAILVVCGEFLWSIWHRNAARKTLLIENNKLNEQKAGEEKEPSYIFLDININALSLQITAPEFFNGFDDRSDTIHDLFTRTNYPLIQTLMYDLNFTLNLIQVDQVGWKINESFTGVMGKFQNKSIELGCLGVLMRTERMEVVDFTIVTLIIKTGIFFKQPPLSLVSNIFELPFSVGVWFSCCGFVIIYWLSLMVFKVISKSEPFTPIESLIFMIGTMCQQSYALLTHFNGTKLLFFFAKLASFFIFTSYSASIVALLQSPSRAIMSVTDLTASPLKVGAMDTVYGWVYFNESKDPAVQKLFRKKITPQGKAAFTEADVGMGRVKNELYAFQVESNAGYQLIKNTFTQLDTCKLHELEAIRLPPFGIPVVKGSKYRELIRQRLVKQQEVGIIRRFNRIWLSQKPVCESGSLAFNSVGLIELRYAYFYVAAGYAAAIILIGVEIAWNRWFLSNRDGVGIDAEEQKVSIAVIGKGSDRIFLN